MSKLLEDIKKLRALTGAGLTDVKKAIEEAAGDLEKAIELIRKRGQAIAAKRRDHEAEEGCILAAHEGDYAVMVGVKCETDFVAKNEDFIKLVSSILEVAKAKKGASRKKSSLLLWLTAVAYRTTSPSAAVSLVKRWSSVYTSSSRVLSRPLTSTQGTCSLRS